MIVLLCGKRISKSDETFFVLYIASKTHRSFQHSLGQKIQDRREILFGKTQCIMQCRGLFVRSLQYICSRYVNTRKKITRSDQILVSYSFFDLIIYYIASMEHNAIVRVVLWCYINVIIYYSQVIIHAVKSRHIAEPSGIIAVFCKILFEGFLRKFI